MDSPAQGGWQKVVFHHSGDESFSEIMRCIREAKKLIQIETYIFEWDPLTRMLLQELKQARLRGVEVQLLVDGVGSYYWLDTLQKECWDAGLKLRVWQPLPRSLSGFLRFFSPMKFQFIRLFRRINRRNHRKIVLIDGMTALLGSMNWTQVHSEKLMGPKAWRDSQVLVEGDGVQDLHRAMTSLWERCRKRQGLHRILRRHDISDPSYNPQTSLVRLNQDRRARRYLKRDLLHRLNRAQKRIWIESAYFLPSRTLVLALKKAARRGVQVEVIIPGPSDVPMVKWAAAGISQRLCHAGVRIHEYQNRILHAKFLLIDDWASLGSFNFNHRSLFHDLESEATFVKPEHVQSLAEQWQRDRKKCKAITAKDFQAIGLFSRWLHSMAFRLRYFL